MLQGIILCLCIFLLMKVYLQGKFLEAGLLSQKASAYIILSSVSEVSKTTPSSGFTRCTHRPQKLLYSQLKFITAEGYKARSIKGKDA